jgi:hypothetical protein
MVETNTQEPKKNNKRRIYLSIGAIVIIAIIATGIFVVQAQQAQQAETARIAAQISATATMDAKLNGPCGTQRVADASQKIGEIFNRWIDAEKIASSTSRSGLSGPVSNLQAIKRDMEAMTIPDCLKSAKFNYSYGMNSAINGYLLFMKQESTTAVNAEFQKAARDIGIANDEIQKIIACAPDCGTK